MSRRDRHVSAGNGQRQRRVDVVEFIALAEAMGLDPNKLFRRVTAGVSRDIGV